MARGNEVAQVTELSVLEKVAIQGDLSALNPQERFMYYTKVCESLGLNPLTKPFDYLQLDGKLTLYAKRDATDQLRKLHSVSITIVNREKIGDVYCVTARGTTPDGRCDESIGAVSLVKAEKVWDNDRPNSRGGRGAYVTTGKIIPLSADDLANALMKAEAKAKRRVTLSIVGLGMMDESEIETAQNAERIIIEDAPVAPNPEITPSTGTNEKPAGNSNQTKQTKTEKPTSKTEKKDEGNAGSKHDQTPESPPSEPGNHFRLIKPVEYGKSPAGTEYAKIWIADSNGEKGIVLANEPSVITATRGLSEEVAFSMTIAIENGFKIAKGISPVGDAA